MRTFQPAFAFWPPPQFLGESRKGFSSWIVERDTIANHRLEQLRSETVKQIVEAHHDRSARTIGPRR